LPRVAINWRAVLAPPLILLAALALLGAGRAAVDRPVEALIVEGTFQRVTPVQIEAALAEELEQRFLALDLDRLSQTVADLDWVDTVALERLWPGSLKVRITEHQAAASWGDGGLLNTRGELFVTDARHIPAELPRLSGPEGRSAEVAQRYLKMHDELVPRGLDLRRVHLDDRGAWDLTLQNGIEVRLGRRDVDARSELFLVVVAVIISSRSADIDFIDMRYSNGFTIGWTSDSPGPVNESPEPEQTRVAGPMH
jgi:cell division protein FtsQ